jgi:outer membrane receptor protein involved in Fe transport
LFWASAAPAQKPGLVPDPTEIALESLFTMEVTTASRFPEKLSGAPGVMSVVTRDELQRFGAVTLREALERVPGLVAATGYFSDRSMVAVHGGQAKDNGGHILILINGRPTREVMDGGIIGDLMQSFPVNILERIEVIRGPGSVLYGTNAFSGVINLITRKAAAGNTATMRTWSLQPGAGGVSGEILFRRGALDIVAAGQARYDPTWNTGYRYEFASGGAFAAPLSFQRVSIRDRGPGAYLGVNYKGLRWMGAYTDWQSAYFAGAAVGENRWKRGFTNLGYSRAISAKWDMNFDLTHTRTHLAASGYPFTKQGGSDTVLEWSNLMRPTRRDQLTFGALYDYVEGNQFYYAVKPAIPISQGHRSAGAFYVQLDHRLTGTLKLIAGLQSNKIGPLGLDTVPRAGVVWSPASRLHFKALYGNAFRAPSINETRLNHPDFAGNPALKPEMVRTFDAGVTYQSNKFLAGINFFDSRQTGIITPDSSLTPVTYRNANQVRIRGATVETKYYLGERFFLYGSLLRTTQSPAPLPAAPWTVSGGASYQARKSLTLTLSDIFHSTIPHVGGINPEPSSYHLVNAHARFELARVFGAWAKGIALYSHGLNLANREIWLPAFGSNSFTLPFERRRTIYYGIEVALFRE